MNFEADLLMRKSNIGVKGVWINELNQNDSTSQILREDNNVISNVSDTTVHAFNEYEPDEPFLLRFGPQAGDKYISRGNKCSQPQILERKITVLGKSVSFVLICEDGYLSFTHREETSNNLLVTGTFSSDTVVIAPLLIHRNYYGYETTIEFLDYSCLYSLEFYSAESYFNDGCSQILSRENPTSSFPLLSTYGISDDQKLAAVVEWNEKIMKTPLHTLDITVDDEISRFLLGENSTKYVNLAGNVLKRETREESDLSVIDAFISQGDPSFRAQFAYVVTWYKIGTTDDASLFNTFQCIITCGADSCFIIHDFYQLQWGEASFLTGIRFKGK